MHKIFFSSLTTLIAMSFVTTSYSAEPAHHGLKTNEIDTVIGQWDYDLLAKDGTKIKGFFQVEPSNKTVLPVVGQAYFDKGDKKLSAKNLRGVWTGSLKQDEQQHGYVLNFVMRASPVNPDMLAESPYHGTIVFHQKGDILDGTYSDHDAREGIGGTITAYRHPYFLRAPQVKA